MNQSSPTFGRRMIKLLAVIAVLCVVTAIYYPYSPGGRQARNFKLIDEYRPRFRAMISDDARFSKVDFMGTTARDGSVVFFGAVRSLEDLHELQQRIAGTAPAFIVAYERVRVVPAAEYDQFSLEKQGL